MSYYPEQMYTGGTGEAGIANFRPSGTAPDFGQAGRDAVHHLAATGTTRGEFGLLRVGMSARPGGPRTHFHKSGTGGTDSAAVPPDRGHPQKTGGHQRPPRHSPRGFLP